MAGVGYISSVVSDWRRWLLSESFLSCQFSGSLAGGRLLLQSPGWDRRQEENQGTHLPLVISRSSSVHPACLLFTLRVFSVLSSIQCPRFCLYLAGRENLCLSHIPGRRNFRESSWKGFGLSPPRLFPERSWKEVQPLLYWAGEGSC